MTEILGIGAARSRSAGEAPAARPSDSAARALPYDVVSRGSKSGELTPAQQFESFVLQSFIEPMLPKDDTAYFGGGTAGSIWKSMLAERIGAQMAAAGGIGIAGIVEARNASIAALDRAKNGAQRDAAAAQGAALSKPGAL